MKFHEYYFIIFCFFMFIYFLSFNKAFDKNILFFSWYCLKKQNKSLIFPYKKVLGPITNSWFQKTSFLINSGNYVYKNFNGSVINKYNFKKKTNNIKFKIIENAFVYILGSYFKNVFYKDKEIGNTRFRLYVCLFKIF
jgi:hypothetical protein